jgi:octaprenyl-diphosphate synthase
MSILANASKRLSKGELLQIEKSRKMNINEEDYFHIISDKTAALISAASQLGALTVSDKKEDHENLKLFGENLGMAFQIKDDLLDYNGHQNIIGKPVGNDFEDKKITLPLLIAFRSAEDKQIKRIKKMLKKGVDKKGKNLIIDFVNQYDGINTSEKMCQEYANKAKENIANYPDSDVKTALYDLSDYVVSRKK